MISDTTTSVFKLAPSVNLAAVILAGLMVPLAGGGAIVSFEGDFVLFAYLMAMGKFARVLAAMDTGSSFEGMGASREVLFSGLVEPAFFLLMAGSMAIAGQTSLADALPALQRSGGLLQVALVLGVISFFIMLLVEGCRVPVDDPNTHLELTMIHEVMVLDHAGPDPAFLQYAAALKMVIVGALIAALVLPAAMPLGVAGRDDPAGAGRGGCGHRPGGIGHGATAHDPRVAVRVPDDVQRADRPGGGAAVQIRGLR